MTYNVAGESPSEDLSGLFEHFQDKHDIYVVALQELPYSVIITCVDAYMKQLDALFEAKGYVRLEKKRMTVTALYIYVKQNEVAEFGQVAVSYLMKKKFELNIFTSVTESFSGF